MMMHDDDTTPTSSVEEWWFLHHTPRIDLNRLTQVKNHIMRSVTAEAARENVGIADLLSMSSMDGWNQGHYRQVAHSRSPHCQTAYCVAGWVVQMDINERLTQLLDEQETPEITLDIRHAVGDWMLPDAALLNYERGEYHAGESNGFDPYKIASDTLFRRPEEADYEWENVREVTWRNQDTGEQRTYETTNAHQRATHLLGLTEGEAITLFAGMNTLYQVLTFMDRLTLEELKRRACRDAILELARA